MSASRHLISIDSRDRDHTEYTTASRFRFRLPSAITNVSALRILSVEFPVTAFVVNETNQNLVIEHTDRSLLNSIDITEGDYNISTLAEEIESRIAENFTVTVDDSANQNQKRFVITESGGSPVTVVLDDGAYTHTQILAELKTKLDAADTNTYSISYDEETGLLTIAADLLDFTLELVGGYGNNRVLGLQTGDGTLSSTGLILTMSHPSDPGVFRLVETNGKLRFQCNWPFTVRVPRDATNNPDGPFYVTDGYNVKRIHENKYSHRILGLTGTTLTDLTASAFLNFGDTTADVSGERYQMTPPDKLDLSGDRYVMLRLNVNGSWISNVSSSVYAASGYSRQFAARLPLDTKSFNTLKHFAENKSFNTRLPLPSSNTRVDYIDVEFRRYDGSFYDFNGHECSLMVSLE